MLHINITTKKFVLTERLEKYLTSKVNKFEKHFPKMIRTGAQVEVRLIQSQTKDKKHCTCEISLQVPNKLIFASETTGHMYAAVDVATAHVRQQLITYKNQHASTGIRRQLRRLIRKSGPEA